MKLQWKPGDHVRLDADLKSHIGRISADTPGTIIRLEFGRRVQVRFDAGDVWVDMDRLLPAQRTLEEEL